MKSSRTPRQSQYNPITANMSYVVIFGTGFVVVAISIILGVGYFLTQSPRAFSSLVVCAMAFTYIATVYLVAHQHHYRVAAYLLVLFYFGLAGGIAWQWGINTPIGPLFFGLVIVLAGILLTARYALFAATTSGLLLLAMQTSVLQGWHHPDTSWTSSQSDYSDVVGYCVVFCMLALLSWLYNREMERALNHARNAEVALRRQKATLRLQVKEATKDLRKVQLEEMRRMYHFSKLGQLGVTLLHDLANSLTALNLEVDGLEDRHPKERERMQQIIHSLDELVDTTRQRLNGKTMVQAFYISQKISDTVEFLSYKAAQKHITIQWEPPAGSWMCNGDPESFCQIIGIVVNNALDAYGERSIHKDRMVVVDMRTTPTHAVIRISDWGKGIAKSKRKQLFKPHHSSKKSGLGLGLYIAKQMAEMQFGGTIALGPRTDHTEFIIKLPLS